MADTEYTREREAFELWYVGHTFDTTPPEIERNAQGDYILMGTRLAWQAWHAGWLALAALPSASLGEQREPALADAARVLAEFAKTAPGRLPSRVQEAIAVVAASPASKSAGGGASSRYYACPYCDQREGYAHGEWCRAAGTMVKRPSGQLGTSPDQQKGGA
jgi:hypothetical protein